MAASETITVGRGQACRSRRGLLLAVVVAGVVVTALVAGSGPVETLPAKAKPKPTQPSPRNTADTSWSGLAGAADGLTVMTSADVVLMPRWRKPPGNPLPLPTPHSDPFVSLLHCGPARWHGHPAHGLNVATASGKANVVAQPTPPDAVGGR